MNYQLQKGVKTIIKSCAAVAICLTMTQASTAQKNSGSSELQSLEVQENDNAINERGAAGAITFRVFPNPCTDVATVLVDGIAQIRVFDHMLRPVQIQEIITVSGDNRLDMSDLPQGLYHIQVTTRNGVGSQKVYKN